MIFTRKQRSRSRRQEGFALVLVVFMATMLLIGAMLVAPSIRTADQREKEKEMIWRGQQYVRGTKLYNRKTGRFPTNVDDLIKPKIGSLRFMRQAYKDPMNQQDGSWRLIYVGPAGQLIGSLKPRQQNLQFGNLPAGVGTPASALAAPGTPGASGTFGQQSATQSPFAQFGQQGQSATQTGTSNSGTTTSSPPAITGTPVSADQGTDPNAPIPTGHTPTIIGGNIIGVGSKINKKSIKIYDHAKNYRLFEFIWDPSKDAFGIGQAGVQTGTGLGQVPGQSPLGQNPANPQQTPQPPQQPQQNPQQQP